jgi:hypothetical protein
MVIHTIFFLPNKQVESFPEFFDRSSGFFSVSRQEILLYDTMRLHGISIS